MSADEVTGRTASSYSVLWQEKSPRNGTVAGLAGSNRRLDWVSAAGRGPRLGWSAARVRRAKDLIGGGAPCGGC